MDWPEALHDGFGALRVLCYPPIAWIERVAT